MPKFSNQLLDDSNVDVFVGASDDIKQDIDFGKIFGKLRTFSTNKSELIAITFCTVRILNLLKEDFVWPAAWGIAFLIKISHKTRYYSTYSFLLGRKNFIDVGLS